MQHNKKDPHKKAQSANGPRSAESMNKAAPRGAPGAKKQAHTGACGSDKSKKGSCN